MNSDWFKELFIDEAKEALSRKDPTLDKLLDVNALGNVKDEWRSIANSYITFSIMYESELWPRVKYFYSYLHEIYINDNPYWPSFHPIGSEYRIVFDGISYIRTLKTAQINGPSTEKFDAYLGNLSLVVDNAPNTGEPWVLVTNLGYSNYAMCVDNNYIATREENDEYHQCNYTIYEQYGATYPIDKSFLPKITEDDLPSIVNRGRPRFVDMNLLQEGLTSDIFFSGMEFPLPDDFWEDMLASACNFAPYYLVFGIEYLDNGNYDEWVPIENYKVEYNYREHLDDGSTAMHYSGIHNGHYIECVARLTANGCVGSATKRPLF